jgi:predicted alpha/beta hydrolase family esterase
MANARKHRPTHERDPERQPKKVLFVQGGGQRTHDSWDNKLVASLETALGAGYTVSYPPMPKEEDPDPAAWKKAIDRELRRLGDGAIVVGHSIGAAVLVDHLADETWPARPAGLFLVATPFIGGAGGGDGWPSDGLRPTQEVGASHSDGAPIYFYQGVDDETVPPSHADLLAHAFPRAKIRRLKGRDHQLGDDLTEIARDIRRLE